MGVVINVGIMWNMVDQRKPVLNPFCGDSIRFFLAMTKWSCLASSSEI
jgi:hypothetical protein